MHCLMIFAIDSMTLIEIAISIMMSPLVMTLLFVTHISLDEVWQIEPEPCACCHELDALLKIANEST